MVLGCLAVRMRKENRWISRSGVGGWRSEEVAGGPDRVLAVTEEKQTDLTVTNEASPLAQLSVFTLLTLNPVLRSPSLLLSTSDFFFCPYKSFSFSPRRSLTPALPISTCAFGNKMKTKRTDSN